MNAGTLCYLVGFIIAVLALLGQLVGLDLKTVVIILGLICLAPLVSGVVLFNRTTPAK
jgi:hypothetical protein